MAAICTGCEATGTTECPACKGYGRFFLFEPVDRAIEDECDVCDGVGKLVCHLCGGTGRIDYHQPLRKGPLRESLQQGHQAGAGGPPSS